VNNAMSISPSPKTIVTAVLGAAVIGLGTVVVVDRVSGGGAAPEATTASSVSPALRTIIGTAATGTTGGQAAGARAQAAQRIAQLFGLTPEQLKNDVLQGQSLDQIAGANDATIKNEVSAYLNAAIDKVATQGALTSGQAASVKQDLSDLITQLFAADLSRLRPGS
jgi:hypothetical protein